MDYVGFGICYPHVVHLASDLANETPRALITMFFFGMGVILGMPFDGKEWVNESWIKVGERNGVFSRLFSGNGYLGGLLITAFC